MASASKVGVPEGMQPTPYADVNRLLDRLLADIRGILQERLVGLYLYGSLTTGDFVPDSSDIDLLAITSSQMTVAEFEALRAMHQDVARDNPGWEDRIEVAYLSAKPLSMFRSESGPIAIISPGEPFHMRDAEVLREWLQNWYVVREYGVALFGPLPTAIIPLITPEEFAWAVRRYAAEVSQRVRDKRNSRRQAYAILTMCRALHVHKLASQASKRQAALWAQQEHPEWSRLIQSALVWQQTWRAEPTDQALIHAETIRFVDFVSGLLRA
jgi:predicted nucleotidyltransferase